MKKNRTISFIIITIIYILAAVCGIVTYRFLPISGMWLRLLIADIAATILTFIFSVIFKNASVYDPYWSVQPIVILTAFAAVNTISPVKILFLIAVCLWGIRLTANWMYTFHSFEYQDWRYVMLREQTGKFYPFINFTGIHMVPTLVVYGCTIPAVYVMIQNPKLNLLTCVFLLQSVCAMLLQGSADIQMHRFRKAKSQGKASGFIRTGLWKYSRHPNYLGEILMWWGIGLAAVFSLGFKWYFLAGAIANTLLFLIVSIPMADKRQSAKEGFAEYKKNTRMLLPIRKR